MKKVGFFNLEKDVEFVKYDLYNREILNFYEAFKVLKQKRLKSNYKWIKMIIYKKYLILKKLFMRNMKHYCQLKLY